MCNPSMIRITHKCMRCLSIFTTLNGCASALSISCFSVENLETKAQWKKMYLVTKTFIFKKHVACSQYFIFDSQIPSILENSLIKKLLKMLQQNICNIISLLYKIY